jgi:hypothetical protein
VSSVVRGKIRSKTATHPTHSIQKHYKTYLSVQILHSTGHAAKKGSSSRNMYSVTRENEEGTSCQDQECMQPELPS